jgi:hypothetical protein
MSLSDSNKRIAGFHTEQDGRMAAVWMGIDTLSDVVTLYDCCLFNKEVLVVIAEGMNARGRWIPIAWESKNHDVSEHLLTRGCNMLYDSVKETPELAEMLTRDIWERMRTGRFKVEKRLGEWLKEFELFGKQDGKVPISAFPLMAATRYAVASLKEAKRLKSPAKHKSMAPKIAIL